MSQNSKLVRWGVGGPPSPLFFFKSIYFFLKGKFGGWSECKHQTACLPNPITLPFVTYPSSHYPIVTPLTFGLSHYPPPTSTLPPSIPLSIPPSIPLPSPRSIPCSIPYTHSHVRRDGYPSSPSASHSYPSWDYYYYYYSLTPPSLPLLLLFRFWLLLHCPLGGQLSKCRRLAFRSTH